MPVKLFLNLRCLQPSIPVARFPTMKAFAQPVNASRVKPIFCGIFPHKLRYCNKQLGRTQFRSIGARRFSTRLGRARSGLASGQEVPASRSLVEDEAELSDWVGGLSSNSFKRTQLDDDSDKDSDVNESESDGFRGGRGNGRRREETAFGRRRRESSFGELNGPGRRGGDRGSEGSYPRRRDSSFEKSREYGRGGRDNFSMESSRRGGGTFERFREAGRGGRAHGSMDSHSRRDSSFEKFRESGSGRGGRTRDSMDWHSGRRENVVGREKSWNSNERSQRGSKTGGRFGGEMEGRRENNIGEKGLQLHNGMGRGGGGGKAMGRVDRGARRRGFVVSDEDGEEDEDEDGFKSYKELIGSDEESEEVDEEEEDDEGGDDVFSRGSVLRDSSPGSTVGSDSYLSETRFDQVPISPLSMKAVKEAGYEKMTVVQEATLPAILKGKDVMAKARTGTGKTVAFLLPSIEVIVKTPPAPRDSKRPPILVLVICPTRELACQAAAEASKLLKYHQSIGVQVVIGGTRLALEQKRMQANPCQILVATPGRLKDHIENTAGFGTRMMGVKVLVLDEADHLLDMGFRKDIERIIAAVPKQRQTLLFSATIPQEVRQICHIALKKDHEYINKVQEGSEETHTQVRQTHLVAPLDNQFPLLFTLLKEHIADNSDYKVLVFCTTAMVTRLVAELLGALNMNVREIHSRKSQSYRTRVSDEFRKSKGLILVTSDVSARGVDYPDVTLVIQIGLPADRQQYIHRLGRTGRKGKEGQGILLLAPWEEFFLSEIKDLPITKATVPVVDPEIKKKIERALSHVGMKDKESAYQAWLGYYNSSKNVGKDKHWLVELANEFSRTMGLETPPAIPKQVLGKMGLRNVPGLRSK